MAASTVCQSPAAASKGTSGGPTTPAGQGVRQVNTATKRRTGTARLGRLPPWQQALSRDCHCEGRSFPGTHQ